MKKKYITALVVFHIIVFLSLLFSCNNSSAGKLAYTDTETVRSSIERKESEISWTKEMEGDLLTTRHDKNEMIDNMAITFTPDIAKILLEYNQPQYPEFEDFGKLDVSNCSDDCLRKIEEFLTLISEDIYSNADSYFNNDYVFNFIFFRKELIDNWKKVFNVDFPQVGEVKKGVLTEAEVEKEKLFDKWIFGQPFTGKEITELPVRLYCKMGIIDITLFINHNKQNSINQIIINRWGKL